MGAQAAGREVQPPYPPTVATALVGSICFVLNFLIHIQIQIIEFEKTKF